MIQSRLLSYLLFLILLVVMLPRMATSFTCFVVPRNQGHHKLRTYNHRSVAILKSERSDATDMYFRQKQEEQWHHHRRVAPIYEKKLDKPKRKTLYDILGASPTASKAELKKLYITLAKQTHPDAQISQTSTRQKHGEDLPEFTEIARAYGVLSDSQKRQKYDRDLMGEAFADQIVEAGELLVRLAIKLGQETLQAIDRFHSEHQNNHDHDAEKTTAAYASLERDFFVKESQ